MTTKKEIYLAGLNRGVGIAQHAELLEIGDTIRTESEGEVVVDENNCFEVFINWCLGAEVNDRQFSPFEFTAKELNELQENKPYDVWEVYEEGVYKGIVKTLKQRLK